MFGRHDDVIKQDQQRDAKILLPDSAMSSLVESQDDGSTSADGANQGESDAPQSQPNQKPGPAPPLRKTSVDGFSAPTGNLSSPLNYAARPGPQPASAPPQSQPATDNSQNQPQPDMEPVELSDKGANNAGYLDHISGPDSSYNEQFVKEPQPPVENNTQHDDNPGNDDAQTSEENPYPDDADAGNNDTPQDNSMNNTDNNEPTDGRQASALTPEDLLNLKQAALQELSPLVDKLNLEPEEKFRTIMMLVQASDNQELLNEAHAAAREIPDEKKRAQALFDLVNEINYFTKSDSKES